MVGKARAKRKLRLSHVIVALTGLGLGMHLYVHSSGSAEGPDAREEPEHTAENTAEHTAEKPASTGRQETLAQLLAPSRENIAATREEPATGTGTPGRLNLSDGAQPVQPGPAVILGTISGLHVAPDISTHTTSGLAATIIASARAEAPPDGMPHVSRGAPAPNETQQLAHEDQPISTRGLGARRPYFIHFHKGRCSGTSPAAACPV